MTWLYLFTSTLVQVVPAAILFLLPFRRVVRIGRRSVIIIIFTIIFSLSVISFLVMNKTASKDLGNNFFYDFLFSILLFFLCAAFINRPLLQVLFVFMVVKSYINNLSYISSMFTSSISKSLSPHLLVYKVLALVFFSLLTFYPMYLFMSRLTANLVEQGSSMPYWKFLWLLPFSLYIVFKMYVSPKAGIVSDATRLSDLISPIIWSLTTLTSFGVTLFMLRETTKTSELHEKLKISQMRVHLQEERFIFMRENVFNASRSQHDMRHNLLAIRGYVEKKDFYGASQYIDTYIDSIEKENYIPFCDNMAIDAVLGYYISRAKKAGAEVSVSILLPQALPISQNDICIVLGNLVENASEACERQQEGKKFIEVKAAISNGNVIAISVLNSCDKANELPDGRFSSFKRAKNAGGIGLESVRYIAKSYNGMATFKYDNHTFRSSVLLSLKSEKSVVS